MPSPWNETDGSLDRVQAGSRSRIFDRPIRLGSNCSGRETCTYTHGAPARTSAGAHVARKRSQSVGGLSLTSSRAPAPQYFAFIVAKLGHVGFTDDDCASGTKLGDDGCITPGNGFGQCDATRGGEHSCVPGELIAPPNIEIHVPKAGSVAIASLTRIGMPCNAPRSNSRRLSRSARDMPTLARLTPWARISSNSLAIFMTLSRGATSMTARSSRPLWLFRSVRFWSGSDQLRSSTGLDRVGRLTKYSWVSCWLVIKPLARWP